MPTTIVIESEAEFIERHGGQPMPLRELDDDGVNIRGDRHRRWILPSGATFSEDPNMPRSEPPNDAIRLAKYQALYWRSLADYLEASYTQLVSVIQTQLQIYVSGSGPMPDQAALDDVKEIRRKTQAAIEIYNRKQARYRELAGPSPAERQAAERERRRAEAKVYEADLFAACNSSVEEQEEKAEQTEQMIGGFFKEMGDHLHRAADQAEARRNLFSKKGK